MLMLQISYFWRGESDNGFKIEINAKAPGSHCLANYFFGQENQTDCGLQIHANIVWVQIHVRLLQTLDFDISFF